MILKGQKKSLPCPLGRGWVSAGGGTADPLSDLRDRRLGGVMVGGGRIVGPSVKSTGGGGGLVGGPLSGGGLCLDHVTQVVTG